MRMYSAEYICLARERWRTWTGDVDVEAPSMPPSCSCALTLSCRMPLSGEARYMPNDRTFPTCCCTAGVADKARRSIRRGLTRPS